MLSCYPKLWEVPIKVKSQQKERKTTSKKGKTQKNGGADGQKTKTTNKFLNLVSSVSATASRFYEFKGGDIPVKWQKKILSTESFGSLVQTDGPTCRAWVWKMGSRVDKVLGTAHVVCRVKQITICLSILLRKPIVSRSLSEKGVSSLLK